MATSGSSASSSSCDRVDLMKQRLRDLFDSKSGYKDPATQRKLLEKHFALFDTDRSGVIDFDEFSRAMNRLNFVGVQGDVEQLFDSIDEDQNGSISYAEFAHHVFGLQDSTGAASGGNWRDLKAQSLLEQVKTLILDNGGKNGIRTLRVILRRMDQNGNGTIESNEFFDGLLQLGLDNLNESEVDKVFRYFDRDRSGRITVDELLRGLRGTIPKRRIKLIKQAFECLDLSRDGQVTLDEIENLYDASQHPEVLAGRMTPRVALLEFMRVFQADDMGGQSVDGSEVHECDGVITWSEFLTYYKDLSGGIENDDEFELMMRNAWHLSGGTGWCANTSNRRVLVTFIDNSQQIVEIENDLDIAHSKDKRKLLQRLVAQGHRNILEISLTE